MSEKWDKMIRALEAAPDLDSAVKVMAATLGRRGGLKGGRATGASKRRGDSAHYRALRAKRKAR